MEFFADALDNDWYIQIAVIIVILLAAQLVIRQFSGAVIRRMIHSKKFSSKRAEEQREETLTNVINKVTGSVVWIIGFGLILSQFNLDWEGMLAGAGVLGIIIGFGAQKVLGDFLSGFFILLENQYGIGDVVEVEGMAYGVVEHVYLRTTHIRNLDGGMHIIANGEIVNMANHSYGWATALVYQWVHYDTDVKQVEKLANKVGLEMSEDKVWAEATKAPMSFDRVEDYGSDGIKVRITGDTSPGMQWAVAGEFRQRLKAEFDKAAIKPAYPHRIVENYANNPKKDSNPS